MPRELHHIVELVRTDIHQSVTAVVDLAAAVDIAQFTNSALGKCLVGCPHVGANSPLVMNGYAHPFFLRFRHHRIRLLKVDAHRLFNIDMDTVFQHAHREIVVKFGARRYRHDIGPGLANHLV